MIWTMNFIFSYDISSDKLRLKVAQKLEKMGCFRVQKSVFIGNDFTTKEVNLLRKVIKNELSSTLKEDSDSFLCLPINKTQKAEMWWLKPNNLPDFELKNVIII